MSDEKTLLEAARKRDQEALIKIFELYSDPLYNYALRLTNDPLKADHIVGDVFAKLLEQWSAGSGPSSNLRSYLYETTYHLIIDEARYSHREAALEADFFRNEGSSTIKNLENRALFEAVILAMKRQLTEDQRHVIILRFLEGFSLRETADILGKESSNTTAIFERGFARLKKTLGIEDDAALESHLFQLRHSYQVAYTPSPAGHNWVEQVRSRLAGDGTTDAPPLEGKKKKKGKGK
jgi:RNA polymerase sigma-70 factor, ECF subfamily